MSSIRSLGFDLHKSIQSARGIAQQLADELTPLYSAPIVKDLAWKVEFSSKMSENFNLVFSRKVADHNGNGFRSFEIQFGKQGPIEGVFTFDSYHKLHVKLGNHDSLNNEKFSGLVSNFFNDHYLDFRKEENQKTFEKEIKQCFAS